MWDRQSIKGPNKSNKKENKKNKKAKKKKEELKNRRDGHKEWKDGASKWYMGEEIMMEGGKALQEKKGLERKWSTRLGLKVTRRFLDLSTGPNKQTGFESSHPVVCQESASIEQQHSSVKSLQSPSTILKKL